MEHGFALDGGEAHLMFPAKPGNGAGEEGRIGGRLATRSGAGSPALVPLGEQRRCAIRSGPLLRPPSFRSGAELCFEAWR